MFTGLIDDVGTVQSVHTGAAGREIGIACSYEDIVAGESVAVGGVCMTVRDCRPGWFSVAAAEPTLARTAIGEWQTGHRLNLERALRPGDRLGGHIVQGHVDAVGRVLDARMTGDVRLMDVSLPPEVREFVVLRGSIALDGVSLTVNALPAPDALQVALIEFTLRHTTLGDLREGTPVHLEADVIAKYVRALLGPYGRND